MIPRRITPTYPGMFVEGLLGIISGFEDREPVHLFEDRFASYVGADNCIAFSSGRIGLYSILKALDPEPGSEVLMPALNFHIVPGIVLKAGLKPVFADVHAQYMNLDPEEIEKRISPNTRVVIAPHLFGQPCAIEAARELCRKKGIFLIEDCAHALGAKMSGRQVGAFGHAAFFSFETVKHVNTLGGGMVVVESRQLAERIRGAAQELPPISRKKLAKKLGFAFLEALLSRPLFFSAIAGPALGVQYLTGSDGSGLVRWYKKRKKKKGDIMFAYSAVQAELGMKQLGKIDSSNEKRREYAGLLTRALRDVVSTQRTLEGSLPTYYLYVIRFPDPLGLIKALFKRGVDASGAVLDYCPTLFGGGSEFPVSRGLADELVQIPFHPSLSREDIVFIAKAVKESVEEISHGSFG